MRNVIEHGILIWKDKIHACMCFYSLNSIFLPTAKEANKFLDNKQITDYCELLLIPSQITVMRFRAFTEYRCLSCITFIS